MIGGRPFTGDGADGFAFCAEEPPTTTGGLDPVAISGVEACFLFAPAAEAYEGAEVAAEGVGAGLD